VVEGVRRTFLKQGRRRAVIATLITAACGYGLQAMGFLDLSVQYYSAIFPFTADLNAIEALQAKGTFPSLKQVVPTTYCCAILTLLRVVLTDIVFRPIADSQMKLKALATTEGRRTIIRDKFTEVFWRFVLYCSAVLIGLWTLWGQPWMLGTGEPAECWSGWPLQTIEPAVYNFYVFSSGMYLHFFFFQFVDVQKKDFWEMLVHHIATIFLMLMSWLTNFVRIGTLVLLLHDFSDVFLESAKLFNYVHTYGKKEWSSTVADILFYAFAVSFVGTRLVFFPFYILNSTLHESKGVLGEFPGYYVFNGLLIVLQLLHLFWASMILGALWTKFTAGTLTDKREE